MNVLVQEISKKKVSIENLKNIEKRLLAKDKKKFKNCFSIYRNYRNTLHHACHPSYNQVNRLAVIRFLVEKKNVPFDEPTDVGDYPLHILLGSFNQSLFKQATNKDSLRMMDEYEEVARYFFDKGAKIKATNNSKITPFMLYLKHFINIEYIKKMLKYHTIKFERETTKTLLSYCNQFTYIYMYSVIFKGKLIKTFFEDLINTDLEKIEEKEYDKREFYKMLKQNNIEHVINKDEFKQVNVFTIEMIKKIKEDFEPKMKLLEDELNKIHERKINEKSVIKKGFKRRQLKAYKIETTKRESLINDDKIKKLTVKEYAEKKKDPKNILYEDGQQLTVLEIGNEFNVVINAKFILFRYIKDIDLLITLDKQISGNYYKMSTDFSLNIDVDGNNCFHFLMSPSILSQNSKDIQKLKEIIDKDLYNKKNFDGVTPLMFFMQNYNPEDYQEELVKMKSMKRELEFKKKKLEIPTTTKIEKIEDDIKQTDEVFDDFISKLEFLVDNVDETQEDDEGHRLEDYSSELTIKMLE